MKTCSVCGKHKARNAFYNYTKDDRICIKCRDPKKKEKHVPPREFERLIQSGLSRSSIMELMLITEYQYTLWMKSWKPSRDPETFITPDTLKTVWTRIEKLCSKERSPEDDWELENLTMFYSKANILDEQNPQSQ